MITKKTLPIVINKIWTLCSTTRCSEVENKGTGGIENLKVYKGHFTDKEIMELK